MVNGLDINALAAEQLSALADGELNSHEVAAACASWRDSEAVRARWHSYQLIGDVLRSEDFASTASRDASFLAALRTRLAAEPVVLAPEPLATPLPTWPAVANGGRVGGAAAATRDKRGWWMAPSAVAAGFVVIAGMLLLTQAPKTGESLIASTTSVVPAKAGVMLAAVPSLPASASVVEPLVLADDAQVIRDARLDRYLAAHKQFAGSSVLGMSSGFVRAAAAEAPKH